MINIKKKSFYIITLAIIAVCALAGFEFYVWQEHDFHPRYKDMQYCIEKSPLTPEENLECQKLKDDRAR